MLSVFPELFTYSLLAPVILRIFLGLFFVITAIQHSRQKELVRSVLPSWMKPIVPLGVIIEGVLGILLIIGLYTQVAALLTTLYALKMIVIRVGKMKYAVWCPHTTLLYFMILAVSLALLFLGAGVFAFDLPL